MLKNKPQRWIQFFLTSSIFFEKFTHVWDVFVMIISRLKRGHPLRDWLQTAIDRLRNGYDYRALSYPKGPLGNSSRLEIFCSSSPQMKSIWDSTQKTSLQLAVVVATVACPFTVLLNIVVIATIKKVRQLQTNSNILIASLAAAGLLVGAVCMPLTISLDRICIRKRHLHESPRCYGGAVHCLECFILSSSNNLLGEVFGNSKEGWI